MQHIKAIKEDDHKVFELVYEQYHQQIYSFIQLKTRSDYISEEVTQLTFIRLWNQRNQLNENLSINIQIFGMARQVMIDLLRKESNRFKHEGESSKTPFTDSMINAIESKDLLQIFEQDIKNMPN